MAAPEKRMSVDEFLVWAEGQEGRWELYRGVPYLMAPERTRHGEVKFAGSWRLSRNPAASDCPAICCRTARPYAWRRIPRTSRMLLSTADPGLGRSDRGAEPGHCR